MNMSAAKLKNVFGLAAGGLIFISFGAVAGGPIGASFQTNVNEQTALGGDNGNADPVVVSVLLTQNNGLPTPRLGENNTQDLPAGWYFRSDFNGQDISGCKLDVSNFLNKSWGIYTFELAPVSNNAGTCTWTPGEYHYALTINRVGQGGGRYRGSALGSFVIPEAPPAAPTP
jgi:hypothetical protein